MRAGGQSSPSPTYILFHQMNTQCTQWPFWRLVYVIVLSSSLVVVLRQDSQTSVQVSVLRRLSINYIYIDIYIYL